MRPNIVARIHILSWSKQSVETSQKLRLIGLISPADHDNPFGKWTLCAELWDAPNDEGETLASIQFLSPNAPVDMLQKGKKLELYQGAQHLADIEVLTHNIDRCGMTDTYMSCGPNEPIRVE